MTHDFIGPAERRTSRRNVLTGGAAIAGGGALAAATAGRTAPMIQRNAGHPCGREHAYGLRRGLSAVALVAISLSPY